MEFHVWYDPVKFQDSQTQMGVFQSLNTPKLGYPKIGYPHYAA